LVLLYFIGEIVKERQDRARGVADEIARTWGGRQTIAGPVLTVIVPENADHGEKGRSYMTIMPDRLAVKIVAKPQERKRGLFSVSVYDSEIEISGSFVVPAQLFVDGQAIEASRVNLQLFVSD